MIGSTTPFPPEQLTALYGTRDAYLAAFATATDAAVDAGFVLAADADTMQADARAATFT
jgi:hypothetical protein